MNCTNQKTRMTYFSDNMRALGIPWKTNTKFLTFASIVVLTEQILTVADKLGHTTTVREIAFAGNLLDQIKIIKALTFAGMLGVIIGSLAQAEYQKRTCGGSPILDLIDFAQRHKLYRHYLMHVWVANPAIYTKSMAARQLTIVKMGASHAKRKN